MTASRARASIWILRCWWSMRAAWRWTGGVGGDDDHDGRASLSARLGVDIVWEDVAVVLASLRGLLAAATPPPGKADGIHAMTRSMIFKGSPEQVSLIMIN